MNRFADGLIAYRILKMLVTPFKETEAYKLGIIDDKGKNLKKVSQLDTAAEKDAYSILYRLVFNMKKIINRLPGGESKIKTLVAALFLIKEQHAQGGRVPNRMVMEDRFNALMHTMDDGVILVEEEIALRKFMQEEAPANAGGTGVALGGEVGANTGTVAGMDMPLKNGKLVKRKKKNK
jgi:hypothetical protein